MASKNLTVFLVAVLAIAALAIQFASAGQITAIEVDGTTVDSSTRIAVFAGQSIPVRITYNASENAQNVRVKAWISGDRGLTVSTDRFDVIAGNVYSRAFSLRVPSNVDPDEQMTLNVKVESQEGTLAETSARLTVQRESYVVEVLSVAMETRAKAGDVVTADVVLKNRGRHFAEDTFVVARIPELGVETRAYFEDLAPVDQGGNVVDKQDSVERRLFLRIPSTASAGLYTVEFEAFNADTATKIERRLLISGVEEDTQVIPSVTSKTFEVGRTGVYTLTLVNRGNTLRVYELALEQQPADLSVDLSDSVVVVPAGSSRTVRVETTSQKAGTYNFAISVRSDGKLLQTRTMTANVASPQTQTAKGISTDNTTILLTVILAIVFVVLLIVLIVLLTRKPEKSEEYGESYY